MDILVKEDYDFVYVHVEAPDEMGHQGSAEKKIQAIAPTAIPLSRSTADTIAPLSPVFSWKEDNAGLVPAPQNQQEFAGFNPWFLRSMLRGWFFKIS